MKIEQIARSMTPIADQTLPKELQKMLMVVTFTEGTDRDKTPYNELFGFDNFTDMSKHPNKIVEKNGYKSTAAGRYQILYRTYLQLGGGLFTPERQDFFCTELFKWNHATNFIMNENWEQAILACNRTWASFPKSPFGQPVRTMDDCLEFINYLQ